MNVLRFSLLGSSHIQQETGQPVPFRSKKAKALLIYLAVMAEQAHNRDQLTALFYPGTPEKSASANLGQLRYQIRQAVPVMTTPDGKNIDILILNDITVQINAEYPCSLDIHAFTASLQEARQLKQNDWLTNEAYQRKLEETAAFYQGPFLTDFFLTDSAPFEEWAQLQRYRLRHDALDTLTHLTEIAIHQKNYDQARDYANQQLQIDNLREQAYRQMMDLLSRQGLIGEAMAQYEKCARLLRADMSMAPSAKTTALFEQIRHGHLDESQLSQIDIRGYTLNEKVAAGAFGEVYQASQTHIGREVAIKVIRPHYASEPEFIRRFEAEARMVARLEHPHIVPLYDYWREPDGAYLVMRWFAKGTLAEALTGEPWDPARILRMTDQLGSALEIAHRNGIIHRDLKPANILLDDDGNVYLTDFGIAKDILSNSNLTEVDAMIGTPSYISPEQILNEPVSPQTDIYAFGIILFELLTGQKPFPGASVPELIYKHLNEKLPAVSELHPDLPTAVDAVIWQTTTKTAADRYDNILELREALQNALGEGYTATEQAHLFDPLQYGINPYRGLRAFQEGDADVFYGRSTLVQNLLNHWQTENLLGATAADRFLAVVGPSGSGKSSVVRAGLIPALRNGTLPESDKWFITTMLPGTHPFEELETALRRVAIDAPSSLLEPLQKDERGLVRVLRHILPDDGRGQPGQLVLIIDQFEELFTLVEEEAKREAFLDNLLTALGDIRSQLRVVVTIRADFYDRPLQHGPLGELLRQQTEVVLPLNPAELEEAIRIPAVRSGARLEDGLITAITADVNEQPGALPLLQYTLTELYDTCEGQLLTTAAYRELGGVLGAIGRRAAELYAALDPAGQAATRQLFLRLVTLGEGVEDTRRRVLRSELEALGAADNGYRLSQIIDLYGRYRLLTFDRDPVTRGPTVEVAHEALLREWVQLREWLDESRADVRLQRLLGRFVAEWQAAGQDNGYLLRGARLSQFESWAETADIALTPNEQAFLQTSLAARQQRQAEEAVRQQRELETAQKLAATERERAEAEQHRAATQAHAAQRLRQFVAGLAILLLVAIGATVFAVIERNNAQANFVRSEQIRLASQAQLELDRGRIADIPALLALRSLQLGYSPEADGALQAALRQGFSRQTYTGHTDMVTLAEYSPDGRFIVTSSRDGTARIWEAQTGAERLQFSNHNAALNGGVFSHDGRYVLSAGFDDNSFYWEAATGTVIHELSGKPGTVWGIAISPDNKIGATNADETIFLWDLVTGAEIRQIEGHEDMILWLDFSPDGTMLASTGNDETIRLWDVASGTEIRQFLGHTGYVGALDFSPDGRYLVSSGQDRTVRLWDVATGQELQRLLGHTDESIFVDFSPDGTMVLSSGRDQTVRLWDIASGAELRQFRGHNGIMHGVFSPDGRHVVTGGEDTLVRLWDIEPVTEPQPLLNYVFGHNVFQSAVDILPDGRFALTGLPDGRIRLWDVATGQIVQTIRQEGVNILGVTFGRDNAHSLIVGGNGLALIWDWSLNRELQRFTGHEGAVWAGIYSNDGTAVLTGGNDGTARLWSVASGQEIQQFQGHNGAIRTVALTIDGQTALTGSDDGRAILWHVDSGAASVEFSSHHGAVLAVAIAPDSQIVATTSEDFTATLWEATTGEKLQQLVGHTGPVRQMVFSPDGRYLLTGSADQTARLWDVGTGDLLRTYTGHVSELYHVGFSENGQYVLTADSQTAYRWHTELAAVIAFACERLSRNFTAEERALYAITDDTPPCTDITQQVTGMQPTWTPVAPDAIVVEPVSLVREFEFNTEQANIGMDMPILDTFVPDPENENQVVRINILNEEMLALPAYTAANPPPFSLAPPFDMGPFPKGEPLGFTIGDYVGVHGQGTYTVNGNTAIIEMHFEHLPPNGVHTMWCNILNGIDMSIVESACYDPDGIAYSFMADENGNGHLVMELPAFPLSSDESIYGIAVAYHSDGQTYGDYLGEHGMNAHGYMFYDFLPPGQ